MCGRNMKNRSLGLRKWLAACSIDEAAGEARQCHITTSPGQDLVYMTKLSQAKAFQSDIARSIIPGPYLQAEAEALNITVAKVAANIITASNNWEEITGPKIEKIRLKAKSVIKEATEENLETLLATAIEALRKV